MTGKRILSVVAATILGGALLSGTAVAGAQAGPTAGKGHCAYDITTGSTACFATYDEVADYAAAGTGARGTSLGITSFTIATLWSSGSGSTPSRSIVGNSCGYAPGTIPGSMNDRTTSISVANGCRVNLWTGSNQTGNFEAHYPGFTWVSYNDQATSYEIYPG